MDGIARLDRLVAGQLNQALLKIVDHLKHLEDLDTNVFNNEEKNLKQMCSYLNNKARELAVEGMSVVEDNVVYQWSRDYWELTNEALGIKKEIPKPTVSPKTTIKDNKDNNQPIREQLSFSLDFEGA